MGETVEIDIAESEPKQENSCGEESEKFQDL